MRIRVLSTLLCFVALLLAACQPVAPREIVFEDAAAQQQLRAMQSVTFAVEDRVALLRCVIVTLQDLDFVINQADSNLGYISASKLNGYNLHVSVMADEVKSGQVPIRVRFELVTHLAIGGEYQNPETYQAFFASLQKNLSEQTTR